MTIPWSSGPFAPVYNVRAYGAVGDGSTDDTTAILNASAAAGTSGVVSLPSGSYRLTTSATLASTISFETGAMVKPDSGVTVTVQGAVCAALTQIIDFSTGGVVVFDPGTAPALYPQWFGAVADGDTKSPPTDNKTAFAWLAASVNATGGTAPVSVRFPDGNMSAAWGRRSPVKYSLKQLGATL